MTEPGQTISASFPLSATSELIADRIAAQAARRSVQYLALLLIPALIGALVGLAVAFATPRVYEAGAIVEMVLHTQPYTSRDRLGKVGLNREAALLISPAFLRDAVASLSPKLQARLRKGAPAPTNTAKTSRELALFHVIPVPATSLLRLSYSSTDPQFAVDVVNALIPAAQLAAPRARNQQIAIMNGFLDHRLQEVATRITAEDQALDQAGKTGSGSGHQVITSHLSPVTRSALRRLRRRKKTRGYGGEKGSTLEVQDDEADPELLILSRESARAEDAQRNALTRLRRLETLSAAGNKDALESMARAEGAGADPYGIGNLRVRIARAQADYAQLSEELGPQQPQILQAVARLDALTQELDHFDLVYLAAAKAQTDVAGKNSSLTNQALKEQQQVDAGQIREDDENAILELELGVDLSTFENMHDLMKIRSTYVGMEAPTLDVVDLATMPATEDPRPYAADAFFGGAGALLLGGLLAGVLYLRRRHLWTISQAERATAMPLMAALPVLLTGPTNVQQGPPGSQDPAHRDAIRELQDAVAALHSFSAVQLILIVEVAPQQHATSLGASLAQALAHAGARVLLVDADLVCPGVHQAFGLSAAPGLSEALTGHVLPEDAIRPAPGIPGLFLLPSGTPPPIASTLVQSGEMRTLLDTLAARFDYVLVSGPPVLASSDSHFLAESVDLLLLVARFARLHIQLLRLAGKALHSSRKPLSGLVVEGTPSFTPDRA